MNQYDATELAYKRGFADGFNAANGTCNDEEVIRARERMKLKEFIHSIKNICEKYKHCSECSLSEICKENFEDAPSMWKE